MLREITAMTRRQGSPVTAVCADKDCNMLITGDHSEFFLIRKYGLIETIRKNSIKNCQSCFFIRKYDSERNN